MMTQSYDELIAAEGDVWGKAAQALAERIPPEWSQMRKMPYYTVVSGKTIEKVLSLIKAGNHVLEIGCSSGWLSLEMARRGAHVEGWDVAEAAIQLARHHAAENPLPNGGSLEYQVRDINHAELPHERYDVIVALGVLHHLAEVRSVLENCRTALKPNGILYVADPLDTPRINALICGGLTFLFPNQISYPQKLRALFRLRGKVLQSAIASIEAQGLSPFEGYGRHQAPLEVIRELFEVREYVEKSAFTGYLMQQIKLPRAGVVAIGRVLWLLDQALVKLHLLRGLLYVVSAVKKT